MTDDIAHLGDDPFTDVFGAPDREAPDPDGNGKPPSQLRDAAGRPIGLRRYCELVTPSWSWTPPHLRYIDMVLDRVHAGVYKRVIVELPPRHGKTEKATVRHPAYRLEDDPGLRIILAAHTDKLAQKFSRKILRIVRGRVDLSSEKQASDDWETTEGGGVRAVGVGTGISGLPGDLILVDDPFKGRKEAYSEAIRDRVWEWFTEDLYTRLEPGAAMVITMTRRHEDDLVGRILASEDAADWIVVRLPALAEANDLLGRAEGRALWPERFNEKTLAKTRRVIGETSFASLYQQSPAPAEGLIFKSQWIRYYTTADRPIRNEDGSMVRTLPPVMNSYLQSWDMSFKDKSDSDYVAGQVWSRLGADVFLRDRTHGRFDFPATIKRLLEMTLRWPKAHLKLVEEKANGPAVISTLHAKVPGLVGVEPEGDKVSRAWSVTPLFEAGNVWLPHPQIAPWVPAYVLELTRFPYGTYDDDVDSTVQALRRQRQQIDAGMSETNERGAEAIISEAALVAAARY